MDNALKTTWGTSRRDWEQLGSGLSNFSGCLLLHMVIPLLPILLEKVLSGKPSDSTLLITISTYSIALAISSRYFIFFLICMFLSIIYACIYGIYVSQIGSINSQLVECYNLVNNKECLNILLNSDKKVENLYPLLQQSLPWSYKVLASMFALHILERFYRHVILKTPFFEFKV